MSPAASFQGIATRVAMALLLAAIALAGLLAFRTYGMLTGTPAPGPAGSAFYVAPLSTERDLLHGLNWSLLRGRVGGSAGDRNALTQRFRLAGTFFEFTATGSSSRLAIVDDAQQGAQLLVSERDTIGDVTIVQIQRDRVVLRNAAGLEAELTLNFSGPGAEGGTNAVAAADGSGGGAFGAKRLGENRWLFNRPALLRYYQELRDQPERLVLLFDSLKPVYTPDHRISGYRLGVEGEKEFFDAVGMTEGDVVRRVNNVEMTNRRRAEFFIGQFVRDDASAFMMEVERAGVTNKMIYEVR